MNTETPVQRVVRLIKSGEIEKVSRWSVLGNFWQIINSLKSEGLFTWEIYEHLQLLEDCAKSSL